jgi:hypothetical protein
VPGSRRSLPFGAVLIYLAVSLAYIFVTDSLLLRYTHDISLLGSLQMAKGLVFVSVSALLGYRLLKSREEAALIAVHEEQASRLVLQSRATNLNLLTEMSSILRGAGSLEAMLPALLDSALAALQTDSGTLSFYDLRSGDLVHAVSRGWMVQTGKPRSGPAPV